MMLKFLDKDIQGYKVKDISKVLIGTYAGYCTIKYAWWKYKNNQTVAKGKKVRGERDSKIIDFKHVENESLITSLTVTELKEHLIKGTFTSVDLVHVFGKRCQSVGRELCLSAEENFDEALLEAEIKDQERLDAIKNGSVDQLPLLHGIPIAIKDLFEQKGKMCTIGCEHLCDTVYTEDCPAVKLFRQAGAIILVRGNLPQLAYSLHSENRVWGIAQNPYDKSRSCGGSSGGDGGLVATRCVPLSFGSDIGGSIRIPSHFNGVRGIRPSPWRVTMLGHRCALTDNFSPMSQIKACIGPMGNSVDDVKLGLETILAQNVNDFDPFVPPCPLRDDLYKKALRGDVRVGYYATLEQFPATQAMQRAVMMAKDSLEEQGFTLVPITFTEEDLNEGKEIFMSLIVNYMMGPMIDILTANYEYPMECYSLSFMFFKASSFLRNFLIMLQRITGNTRMADTVKFCVPQSKEHLESLMKRQIKFQMRMKEKWNQWGVEAIIQPSFPTCSFKHENSADIGVFLDYLNMWSCLHYPVGVVPVGEVKENEDEGYIDNYNDDWTKLLKKDMKGSVGMPISVSVVAQPFYDEIVLGVMKAIDQKINFKKSPTL